MEKLKFACVLSFFPHSNQHKNSIMSLCGKCNEDIDDEVENEGFECDNCDVNFHTDCVGKKYRKSDIKARKGSSCLRILCPDCIVSAEKSIERRMIELMKVVYKIDMCCQVMKSSGESDNQLMLDMAKSLSQMNEKFDKIDERLKSVETHSNVPENKPSYANVTHLKPTKAAVVVKPKTIQDSKKTMQEIAASMGETEITVCDTKNIRDGGIVLCYNNTTDTMRVKEIVREKLGENYEVVLPPIKNPRIQITNIDPEIPSDEIINELKKNNDCLDGCEMKLVTVIPRKHRGTVSHSIIVEVNCDMHKKLLEIGALQLPFKVCKIVEHLYLKRCFKCCGFSHISSQCKRNENFCGRCAGSHGSADCRSRRMMCINCKTANEKFGQSLNVYHHAWSRECKVLERRMAKLRSTIQYNAAD